MSMNTPRWSQETKIIVSLLLLALFIYSLFRFHAIIPPLILAIILAYVLSPLANYIQAHLRLNRLAATAITYLILLLVIISLPMGISPLLGQQFTELNLDIQENIPQVGGLLSRQYVIAGQVVDGTAVYQQLSVALQAALQQVFGKTVLFAVDLITSIVWMIFIGVVSFYLVKDGPLLRDWLEGLVPPAYRPVFVQLRDQISQIWSSFFRGQLVLALVVSMIFMAAGLVLGLPFSLAMGLLAGLLEFLPSLGHGIWLITASIVALSFGSTWMPIPNWAFALIIIALHLFYQQFDLNYLIPRIIGRSVHLPPLVVILGIVAGAVLGGVLGISLAAPTIASARVIGRYIYANLFDLEEISGSVVPPLPPPNSHWWRTRRSRDTTGSQRY